VISNGASRRLFFPLRSCEVVGLRRENRCPIARSSCDEISLGSSCFLFMCNRAGNFSVSRPFPHRTPVILSAEIEDPGPLGTVGSGLVGKDPGRLANASLLPPPIVGARYIVPLASPPLRQDVEITVRPSRKQHGALSVVST
ncbi:MAG: hypothetical protein WA517_03985, partial [Candidatus Acidiferrum sp.]